MEVEFEVMGGGGDLKEVIDLCNECFGEQTPLDYARRIFDSTKSDPNQIYVVGKLNNQIVAHALINIIPTIYQDMNIYAILNHICVRPEFRRHGIGTQLLDYCFAIAKERNCKKVELWSKNFRVAAHGLYHKYGFNVLEAAFFEKEVNYENQ